MAATTPETTAPAGTMTYEQFLEMADEDTFAEWVNGKAVPMSPVSGDHQTLGGFLIQVIGFFVSFHQLGQLFYEPFQMRTAADLPGRSPDILFVATKHLDRLKPNYLEGAADLVVEIISPESRTRDRGEKFFEYEQGGVSEYWLLDPIRRQPEFYQLDANGVFQAVLPDAEGKYHSTVLPGLYLRVEWLWQRPLPPLHDVFRELKLI